MAKGSVQKAWMVGRVGAKPERTVPAQGISFVIFHLAVNAHYKDDMGDWKAKTDWWEIYCFGPIAERAEKWLDKGDLVSVEGVLEKYEKGVRLSARDIQLFGSCLICGGRKAS